MQYSVLAQSVNIVFIAIISVAPIGYCLLHPSIPAEIGRTVIVLSFALGAFVIADWYHFYTSNSYKGLLGGVGLGVGASALAVALASLFSKASFETLAAFENVRDWEGLEWLLRAYVAGIGIAAAAVVSIPRLLIMRCIGNGDLPHATDA